MTSRLWVRVTVGTHRGLPLSFSPVLRLYDVHQLTPQLKRETYISDRVTSDYRKMQVNKNFHYPEKNNICIREGIQKKIDFFLGKSPKLWVGEGQES